MRRVWWMARNDVRLTTKDRTSLIWLLLLPVALMWFFGEVAGGGGEQQPPRIALTVVDRDRGWLSDAFIDELRDESVNLVEMTAEEAAAAEDRVRTLVIPEGFTAKVLAGDPQALDFEADSGSNLEFGLAAQVHIFLAVVRTLATLTEIAPDGTESPVELGERFAAMLEREPLVGLDVSVAGSGTPVPAGFAQSVPGVLTMMVLMMTLIYGGVFLTVEKREGMLRRQSMLPVTRAEIVLGKVTGRILVACMQIVLLILAGRFVFGISLGSSPVGLAALLFSYAFAVAGLATLLGAVASTPEQASGVGWLLSMVLSGLGGCWWPAEVMPGWLWNVAHALPTAWAMDGFHSLISFGHGLESVLLPSAALLGFGALFSAAGGRVLRYD